MDRKWTSNPQVVGSSPTWRARTARGEKRDEHVQTDRADDQHPGADRGHQAPGTQGDDRTTLRESGLRMDPLGKSAPHRGHQDGPLPVQHGTQRVEADRRLLPPPPGGARGRVLEPGDDGRDHVSWIIVGALLLAMIFGGGVITAGVFTGFIIFLGMAVIYGQLPDGVKATIVKGRIFVDLAGSGAVLAMLGTNTATALVGAVSCGLLITLGLHQQKHLAKHESMLVKDVRRVVEASRKL
jgi:hypothetical protein